MRVAAVVVSHGQPRELEQSLPALRAQVDELVVIANVPGSVPDGVDAVHNERPLGFAANVNKGAALTSAELVLSANPDAVRGMRLGGLVVRRRDATPELLAALPDQDAVDYAKGCVVDRAQLSLS